MAKEIKNKVVVITGAAEGIGYEIADQYLAKQAKSVAILDINETVGSQAAAKLNAKHGHGKAVFLKCDVTKDLDNVFKKLVDIYGKIDVLINNAGIFNDKHPKKTIDINVLALIEWTLKFNENMRKDKGGNGGTVVNLASIYGYRVDQYIPIYQASKFAVMGFTKSFGHEYNYNKTGVRAVAICPGFTETKLTQHPDIVWDDSNLEDMLKFMDQQDWQKVEAVGKAAVEVFEKGETGSAWLIEGGRPIVEVKLSSNPR